MARVTALLAMLSLVAGIATFVVGVRVGHGESPLVSHLTWGMLTLVLMLFTAGVAMVHARASAQEIAALRAELERIQGAPAEPPAA